MRLAASVYRKAADQGDANAKVTLDLFYATGVGVPADADEAKKLDEAALAQGNEGARCLLVYLGFDCDPKGKIPSSSSPIRRHTSLSSIRTNAENGDFRET